MASTITAADYRGEAVVGKRWRRAYRVTILNPYGGPAKVAIDEEEVTEIEDRRTAKPTDTLTLDVDLTATVPLINPETGEPTGETTTHAAIYVALYSVYMQQAALRDQNEQN